MGAADGVTSGLALSGNPAGLVTRPPCSRRGREQSRWLASGFAVSGHDKWNFYVSSQTLCGFSSTTNSAFSAGT